MASFIRAGEARKKDFPMKRLLLALAVGAACAGMAACADDYYGGGGGIAYANHPIGYDGYYDDFYGPFYDGYWGDGGFWYSTGPSVAFTLDRGNHFRHDGGAGFHRFHGGMHRRG
jgi:hypothetical protein